MTILYIIPIAIAIVLFVLIIQRKEPLSAGKYGRILLIIGAVFCVLSIISVFLSYRISGDTNQLYKMSLPGTMLIIIATIHRKLKK